MARSFLARLPSFCMIPTDSLMILLVVAANAGHVVDIKRADAAMTEQRKRAHKSANPRYG